MQREHKERHAYRLPADCVRVLPHDLAHANGMSQSFAAVQWNQSNSVVVEVLLNVQHAAECAVLKQEVD